MALTYEDSCRLFSILPPAENKIIAAASARVYHASFGAPDSDWSYSGLRGIIVLGCDNQIHVGRHAPNLNRTTYWFRLVDLLKGRVVWVHQVHEIIEYEAEKPFFHVFCGKSRKFGFRFDEDDEASVFLKEVTRRVVDIPVPKPGFSLRKQKPQSARSPRRPINSSMISSPVPDSFHHVAHLSVDEKGSLESSWNVAPEWTMLLQKLEGYGVDVEMVEENLEFVKGFLAGAEAVRGSASASSASSSVSSSGSDDGYGHYSPEPVRAKRQRTVHRKPVPEYSRF